MDPLDLGGFFKRPIVIDTFKWTIGATLQRSISPFALFFANKRVCNRANNYALMGGTLSVKILINGNSFYYGRLMVDWQPLPNSDLLTPPLLSAVPALQAVGASQRIHTYIDPSNTEGVMLNLPIVWPYDRIDIVTDAFSSVGLLRFNSLNNLKHANAGTGDIDVTVLAWMEDLELSIPTTRNMYGLVNQAAPYLENIPSPSTAAPNSPVLVTHIDCICCVFKNPFHKTPVSFSNQADEYATKPASTIASAVAAATLSLSSVPVIGPYARATGMAIGMVGKLAALFGFSRPINIQPPAVMLPSAVGELAVCSGVDASRKLTVDPKQELSVDPRLCGVASGKDELVIAHLASIPSFLTQFTWSTTVASGTHIWSFRVGPILHATDGTHAFSPACEFAALPFAYWRGMMRFHFTVAKSAFHKGRLQFVWDPMYVVAPEFNVSYNVILDISGADEITIDIPWGSPKPFLPVASSTVSASTATGYTPSAIGSVSASYNGVLAVYVLNDLAVPNSVANNDLQVNVYVSCINMQVAYPTSKYVSKIKYENQADDYCDPVCMKKCGDDRPVVSENFGESIRSFRELLKRFSYNHAFFLKVAAVTAPNTYRRFTFRHTGLPYPRGDFPNGIHLVGAVPTNLTVNHLANYIAPAFLCQRGGFRTKLVPTGSISHPLSLVTRSGENRSYSSVVTDVPLSTWLASATPESTVNDAYDDLRRFSADGSYLTTGLNPNLEYEVPHQSNLRFFTPKDTNDGVFSSDTSATGEFLVLMDNVNDFSVIERYVAAADDYTLVNFQGMPPWKGYGSF